MSGFLMQARGFSLRFGNTKQLHQPTGQRSSFGNPVVTQNGFVIHYYNWSVRRTPSSAHVKANPIIIAC